MLRVRNVCVDLTQQTNTATMKASFRIKNEDGTYLNAGTGRESWFTLDDARLIVDYSKNQRIVENNGVRDLWDVF